MIGNFFVLSFGLACTSYNIKSRQNRQSNNNASELKKAKSNLGKGSNNNKAVPANANGNANVNPPSCARPTISSLCKMNRTFSLYNVYNSCDSVNTNYGGYSGDANANGEQYCNNQRSDVEEDVRRYVPTHYRKIRKAEEFIKAAGLDSDTFIKKDYYFGSMFNLHEINKSTENNNRPMSNGNAAEKILNTDNQLKMVNENRNSANYEGLSISFDNISANYDLDKNYSNEKNLKDFYFDKSSIFKNKNISSSACESENEKCLVAPPPPLAPKQLFPNNHNHNQVHNHNESSNDNYGNQHFANKIAWPSTMENSFIASSYSPSGLTKTNTLLLLQIDFFCFCIIYYQI